MDIEFDAKFAAISGHHHRTVPEDSAHHLPACIEDSGNKAYVWLCKTPQDIKPPGFILGRQTKTPGGCGLYIGGGFITLMDKNGLNWGWLYI